MTYELHYWPGIQGRGEFVRLALEAAGAPYREVPHLDGSPRQWQAQGARPSFAPPYLVHGKQVIGQTAAILLYLGPRLGLVGRSEADRLWTHQIQLTIADFVLEAHDIHHPIASSLYYEQQKPEALRRAADFRKLRLPRFLAWFETVLQANPRNAGRERPHLVGGKLSYADLSLFQVVEGLLYALPRATRRALKKAPRVAALHAGVPRQRRLAAYLASERRQPFNEQDLFRNYPELDG